MNNEFIEIQWTSGSIDEARKISRYLVQERLVASAKIIPWVESVFLLDNQLQTTQESKIQFITQADRYEQVKKIIEENCSYEVPEITKIIIEGGNQLYLDWVKESTPSNFATVDIRESF